MAKVESWETVLSDGKRLVVNLHHPEPSEPSIPDLIARWHAGPTAENRHALWEALSDFPGRSFSQGGTIYRPTLSNSGQVRIIEVY